MERFKSFENRHLKLTSLLLLTISFIIILAKADENAEHTVYTCCYVQNNFKGSSCSPIQVSSPEFDINYHESSAWVVPKIFRQEESEFRLTLATRNVSKPCKSILQISQKPLFARHPEQASHVDYNTVDSYPIFFKNGAMLFHTQLYNPEEYCFNSLSQEINYAVFDIEVFGAEGKCVKQVFEISSLVHPRHYAYHEKWIKDVFAAVAGLSFLFTALNVIIYLSLRKYLNVSGWVEFVYFLALGLFSALSIPALLYEPTLDKDLYCYISGVVLQFLEIATYSSFFLIAFDCYWMIRKSHTFGSYGEEIKDSKMRLILYYLLLISIPVGVTIYGVVLNQEMLEGDDYWVPHYGKMSCFSPPWPLSEYLIFGLESFTFLLILMSVNHIFGRLSNSADMDDPPRVSLLSNMFFFILSYWIMDILKFARPLFVDYSLGEEHSSTTFWIVLEGFDFARGIVAFVVFVFNRKTLRAFTRKSGDGHDGSLRDIFRNACCSARSGMSSREEDGTPMSPLMKSSSMRRTTIRQSHLY